MEYGFMMCVPPGALLRLIAVALRHAVFGFSVLLLCLSVDVHVVSVSAELRPPEGHVCLCCLSEDCVTHTAASDLDLDLYLALDLPSLNPQTTPFWGFGGTTKM